VAWRLNKRLSCETSEKVVASVLIKWYVYDINKQEKRVKTYERKISSDNIYCVLFQRELPNLESVKHINYDLIKVYDGSRILNGFTYHYYY